MNTENRILTHLQAGYKLTGLDGLRKFKTMRLAAYIGFIRDKGHNVKTTRISKNGKTYAEYSL